MHHKLLISIITAAFILQIFSQISVLTNKNTLDFYALYNAATMVRDGKIKDLYDKEAQQESFKRNIHADIKYELLSYRNPPIAAILFVPFTYLDITFSYVLLVSINVMLTLLGIYFIFKTEKSLEEHKLLVVYGLILLNLIALNAFKLAQVSGIIFFTFALLFYLFKQKRWTALGLATGLLGLKVQYLLLFPFLIALAADKKKYLKGFFVSFSLFTLINVIVYGPTLIPDYLRFLPETENYQDGTDISLSANLSGALTGIAGNYTNIKQIAITITFAFYVSYLILLFLKSRSSTEGIQGNNFFASSILAVLIFNLHTMPADFNFFIIPPLLLVLGNNHQKKYSLVGGIMLFCTMLVYLTGIYKVFIMLAYSYLAFYLLLTRAEKQRTVVSTSSVLLLKPGAGSRMDNALEHQTG